MKRAVYEYEDRHSHLPLRSRGRLAAGIPDAKQRRLSAPELRFCARQITPERALCVRLSRSQY
jgi:hypothetical protein